MIAYAKLKRIRTMMADGVSVRKIAKLTGIARQTVAAKLLASPAVNGERFGSSADADCMVCGGPLPCLKCARDWRMKRRLVGKEPFSMTDMSPRLTASEMRRLNRIRQWRSRNQGEAVPDTVIAQWELKDTRNGKAEA